MIINTVTFNKKEFKLLNSTMKTSSNIYSIILGKNASGKSELLRETISSILRVKIEDEKLSPYIDLLDPYLNEKYKSLTPPRTANIKLEILTDDGKKITVRTSKTNEPRKIINFKGEDTYLRDESFRYESSIELQENNQKFRDLIKNTKLIAVSESPYIKFPEMKNNGELNYHYLHHRKTNDSSMKFWTDEEKADDKVQTLTSSLLELLSRESNFTPYSILKFVGLDAYINLKLKLNNDYLRKSEDLKSKYEEERIKSEDTSTFEEDILNANEVIDLFIKEKDSKSTLSQKFSSESVNINFSMNSRDIYSPKAIKKLIDLGILNLIETEFKCKDNSINAMSLSSGQLSILNTVAGIDSLLEDNSIIFIDEPEISLHPEWQSLFMPFITKQFNKYNNCHFIIATHSPHVISNVKSNNSFVLLIDEESVKTIDGAQVAKKSTDLLLTLFFKTPGHKNEYLLRLLLTTYSKLVDKISLNADDVKSLEIAKEYYNELDSDDPVRYITEKALDLYAN